MRPTNARARCRRQRNRVAAQLDGRRAQQLTQVAALPADQKPADQKPGDQKPGDQKHRSLSPVRPKPLLLGLALAGAFGIAAAAEYSAPVGQDYPRNLYWGDTHLHTRNSADAY